MKFFLLTLLVSLLYIISFGQENLNDNVETITFESPLKDVVHQYLSEIHRGNKSQALILLTLNQLDENKQVYRISTLRNKPNIDSPSIIRYGIIENDIVLFSISYNRQLFNVSDSYVDKILTNIRSSSLCDSDEYWEVTIINDKSYQINRKAKGHQTYREGKKIYYIPEK
ncbi:MAG TPA: hypothetical protein VK205_06580 [Prolixibacteraceae bacterium]|nr:hypothetical protein [Prolixibacteraceae bacterium]